MPQLAHSLHLNPGSSRCSVDDRGQWAGMLADDADWHPDPGQRLGQLPDADRDPSVILERARHEEHPWKGGACRRLRRSHATVLPASAARGRALARILCSQASELLDSKARHPGGRSPRGGTLAGGMNMP